MLRWLYMSGDTQKRKTYRRNLTRYHERYHGQTKRARQISLTLCFYLERETGFEPATFSLGS